MQRVAESILPVPPPKKQKLNAEGEEIEEKGAEAGGSECGEDPAIMWGGLGKFLKEADVGITEYISSQPGFFAILKQRSHVSFPLSQTAHTQYNSQEYRSQIPFP